eukprot:TRINITY_DN12936_c0_g1_i1.p1 TRINITY_DN12936_c0_g1~~TRINITY_DN12936_c0_g1_i1.p1  ORF type:complete len:464 (-),score=81.25 TRINITY_DN12936_c0_g1_i1:40-1431(-)
MDQNKKAELMRKVTEEFRREFKIPKPECVIQAYTCSAGGFSRGTLYVSQNYVCFSGGSKNARMPYTKIVGIAYEPGTLGDKLNIKDDGPKALSLSGFGLKQAKEAYELMMYLWQNPPSYVDMEAITRHEQQLAQQAAHSSQAQIQRPQVNTALADSLLSLALDTDMTQNSVMDTVARQGEQIDRIGQTLDTIDGKLQRTEHLLKGIESYRYYMFGRQKKKNNDKRQKALESRTMSLPPNTPPPIEIDILYKKQDDSLHPAILVLEADHFKCVDPVSDKPIEKHAMYKLSSIDAVVIRARHEHLDFRFKGSGPVRDRRCRIMSSYLQALVNQIYVRCKRINHTINISFEPGVRKFEYLDDRVCVMPQASRDGASSNSMGATVGQKTSNLLTGADQQTRQDMDYVDGILDQALDLTRGITAKGQMMNTELDRQNQALGHYNNRVDGMIQHSQGINQRLDHQNDKY